MSTYRDDLGAAVARADALQRELEEVTRHQRVDRARIAELERLLQAAQRELAELTGAEPRRVILQDALRLQPFALVVVAILALGSVVVLPLVFLGDRPPAPPVATVRNVAPGRGHLSVESTPRGAYVAVDGAPVGITPLRLGLSPGSHEVAVAWGGRVQRQHVDIDDDVALALDFTALGATEVLEALGDLPPRLRPCGASGRFDLHLMIGADGQMRSITAGGVGEPPRAPLEARLRPCLDRLAASVRFPPTPRPTRVIVPVVIAAEE